MKSLTIQVADGAQIAARVFEPLGASQGSLVIGGAMGVRQDYYTPFARWLSTQGWCVTTFDYRGSGYSTPDTANGSLRGFKADLMDWARDFEAVIVPGSAGGLGHGSEILSFGWIRERQLAARGEVRGGTVRARTRCGETVLARDAVAGDVHGRVLLVAQPDAVRSAACGRGRSSTATVRSRRTA